MNKINGSFDEYDHTDEIKYISFSEYCELRYKEIINNTPPEYRNCYDAKYLRDQFDHEYNELIAEDYSNNFSDNIESPNSWI